MGDYSNSLREFSKNPSKTCLRWAKSVSDNPELNIPILDSTKFEEAFRKDFLLLLLSGIIYLLLIIFILLVYVNLSKFIL